MPGGGEGRLGACATDRARTHGAAALGVGGARQLERVAVDQVGVGGGDGEDDAGGVPDVLQDHAPDARLDVTRLVAHRHPGDARQVHQRHRPAPAPPSAPHAPSPLRIHPWRGLFDRTGWPCGCVAVAACEARAVACEQPPLGWVSCVLKQLRQVSGRAQDMGAEDLEADGLVGDSLVVAHSALRLVQDLLPDALEVVEALACSSGVLHASEGQPRTRSKPHNNGLASMLGHCFMQRS